MGAGMDDFNGPFINLRKALQDVKRISYHRDYLSNLSAAIRYSYCYSCFSWTIVLKAHWWLNRSELVQPPVLTAKTVTVKKYENFV